MTAHNCNQSSRLLRLETEQAKLEARYRERDEAVRDALLEIGREVTAIGGNVSREVNIMRDRTDRQIRKLFAKIDELVARLGTMQ